jgi:bifunctional oligoribonuclease and PAP phosphatase NrnA
MNVAHAAYVPPHAPALDDAILALRALVDAAQRVVVLSHHNPDGDAVGATLAAALLMEAMGKQVVRLNRDPIPHNFTFLPGAPAWRHDLPQGFEPDLVLLVDCGEPSRPGQVPAAVWASTVAVIDHHEAWDAALAPVAVRDVDAAATGELIYRVMQRWGVPLSLEIAQCLYCCVLTDTGSFRYGCTTPESFQIAGQLLAAGVDPWEMTSHIYESQPRARMELLRQVLHTLSFAAGGRLATIRLDQQMLTSSGASMEMADGFINHGRGVEGVEVSCQLTEEDPLRWRVAFRSRGRVDVSKLAGRFGGGGGRNGAGCTIVGSAAEVEASIAAALADMLDA